MTRVPCRARLPLLASLPQHDRSRTSQPVPPGQRPSRNMPRFPAAQVSIPISCCISVTLSSIIPAPGHSRMPGSSLKHQLIILYRKTARPSDKASQLALYSGKYWQDCPRLKRRLLIAAVSFIGRRASQKTRLFINSQLS